MLFHSLSTQNFGELNGRSTGMDKTFSSGDSLVKEKSKREKKFIREEEQELN